MNKELLVSNEKGVSNNVLQMVTLGYHLTVFTKE